MGRDMYYIFVCVLGILLSRQAQGINIPDEIRTRYKGTLTLFNNARTHGNTAQENNLNATRTKLFEKFQRFNLTTTVQHFRSNNTKTGETANGANVVAVLKGKRFNTSQDKAVVFAANMDTHGSLSYGVNNDGSGLTAMLTLAEDMAGMPCKRDNSVVFVALDFSEIDTHGPHCPSSCGAEAFLDSLPEFIGSGQIQLVFVLKCILNYDWRDHSQLFNAAFQTYFRGIFKDQGLFYSNKGNFIAAVGRNDESGLLTDFEEEFNKQAKIVKDQYTYVIHKFQYNFNGTSIDNSVVQTFPPNDSYTMYLNFWKKNMKAILLTDTCYARGKNDYMQACPSIGDCDDIHKVTDSRLGLLYTVILTLRNMTEKLVDVDECASGTADCSVNATCTNTFGSYSCVCKPNFSGDGKICIATASSGTLNQATALLVQILAFALAFLLTQTDV